ncbi:MAG: oxidoreductase, partial [Rhodospirillaceae bacterium]|nr:oxidoreductase [Rhodospirillaceae bacterium]
MKACVVGAGAIGGILAARLAHAGHEVSAIARGAHLQAIQERGLTLKWAGEQFTVDIRA